MTECRWRGGWVTLLLEKRRNGCGVYKARCRDTLVNVMVVSRHCYALQPLTSHACASRAALGIVCSLGASPRQYYLDHSERVLVASLDYL